MKLCPKPSDCIEILTLIDNYIDIAADDDSRMIKRASPVKNNQYRGDTILAEHGFSALITLHRKQHKKTLLLDFGLSLFGAAYNADILGVDLTETDALALSHGHPDHIGGLEKITEKIGKNNIELFAHPAAFRESRFFLKNDKTRVYGLPFTREALTAAGIKLVEQKQPCLILDDTVLFLGEIPRKTAYEKALPDRYYLDGDDIKDDHLEDDTSIVMNLDGRGLIVISGCAHSGIINTVNYAREITGINKVYAIIGGFHLTGQFALPAVEPTVKALKEINPDYIAPTHCTGRKSVNLIEHEMPDQFLFNMSGSKMIFDGVS